MRIFPYLSICIACILSSGCTVKQAETSTSNQPAVENSHPEEYVHLDKSSTYLAEVTKPLSQMDTILAKLDDLDVHREWTSEDKEITKSKVNELTKGEKITTSFEADAKGKHVQCEVQIIRIAEDELMLRIICSDEELASEMQQHLQD